MTDIVERLRDVVPGFGKLRLEAADEIERLRTQILLLEAAGAEAADEIDRLRAERNQWIANSRENKLIAESNLRERDAARREGIEAAAIRVDSMYVPDDLRAVKQEFYAAIRALLEEDGR